MNFPSDAPKSKRSEPYLEHSSFQIGDPSPKAPMIASLAINSNPAFDICARNFSVHEERPIKFQLESRWPGPTIARPWI